MPAILHFAIDTPLRRVFDYLPAANVDDIRPGMRAWLPFGKRRIVGMLLSIDTHSAVPLIKLRRITEIIDAQPVLDPIMLGILQWAADYYHHPIGEVIAAAIPQALREGAPAFATEKCWLLTALGMSDAVIATPTRAVRMHALLKMLSDGKPHHDHTLADHRAALRTLHKRGYVDAVLVKPEVTAVSQHANDTMAPELTQAQVSALQTITSALGSFRTLLLYGVTGSGKTEVYLRSIACVLERGEQALVLAPEIALTPQLVERFRSRFNVPIVVLHSGLTNSERLAAWRAAREGSAGIIIGTRSAIFTSLAKPGLIIVDEEHDSSYKQQEGFRYSARDLAIVRAQRHGVPVILGSATPALETLHRARKQSADLLTLPQRAGFALTPTLKLIDLRHHATNQGLSTPVMQAIRLISIHKDKYCCT